MSQSALECTKTVFEEAKSALRETNFAIKDPKYA